MKCTEARTIVENWRKRDKNAKICYKIDEDKGTVTLLVYYNNSWIKYVCEQDTPDVAEALCKDCSYHNNDDRCPYPMHLSKDSACEDFLSKTTFDEDMYTHKSPEYQEWERENNLKWWYYWNKQNR